MHSDLFVFILGLLYYIFCLLLKFYILMYVQWLPHMTYSVVYPVQQKSDTNFMGGNCVIKATNNTAN